MNIWSLLFLPFVCGLPFHHEVTSIPVEKQLHQYTEQQGIIKKVQTDHRWIAFTFDDGPDPQETNEILDVLKQYHAKATFFVVGEQATKYPDIVRREVSEGHELANHTYSHTDFKHLSKEEVKEEIVKSENEILSITGQQTILFRPPGGYCNDLIMKTAEQLGYTVILWTWYQDSKDWSKPGVHQIVNRVVSNAHSGDIVLFHDRISGKSQTVKALKVILPELQEQGYSFVTISKLLGSNQIRYHIGQN
ncbi:polysaccharide deacetylase family protein [Paenibacillus sp. IHBB 10380]|uniref:polysaccharide deacetylase family protein n=1 Tax=Paenibacillus sp. IHBB 10380 TaxID=1566358 RepID=UPI000AEA0A38|nr:polysaccharide deacetylase family protein [Paenibacillus sp. IHBB 10380]